MEVFKKFRNSNFYIRLKSWEFWPFELIYIPVILYWIWLAIKARSLFFFSASNPGIKYGGMLGESKIKILDKIKAELKPKTLFIIDRTPSDKVLKHINNNALNYPLIFKPDVGERGTNVEKINNSEEAIHYVEKAEFDFLIQEYIDYPIELGVFYYRYPNRASGRISSIVIKEMLNVEGDGKSTLRELILQKPRAKLRLKSLEFSHQALMNNIIPEGEKLVLEPIGNHCRGTAFLNGNHLINRTLVKTFDKIALDIEGFYFGRFDLKCHSIEDLYQGKVKIMELNGAGSEPAHIYHPGAPISKAYAALFQHMRTLLKISVMNKNLGVNYMSFKDGLHVIKQMAILKKLGLVSSR